MKYQVHKAVVQVKKAGETSRNEENFDFGGQNIIWARKRAINKAKELADERDKNDFQSGEEAEARNYENYRSMIISVLLVTDDGEEIEIYGGSRDENLENLGVEWEKLNGRVDAETDVYHADEVDDIEALSDDIDFILE